MYPTAGLWSCVLFLYISQCNHHIVTLTFKQTFLQGQIIKKKTKQKNNQIDSVCISLWCSCYGNSLASFMKCFLYTFRTDESRKPSGRFNSPPRNGRGFKFIVTAFSDGKCCQYSVLVCQLINTVIMKFWIHVFILELNGEPALLSLK